MREIRWCLPCVLLVLGGCTDGDDDDSAAVVDDDDAADDDTADIDPFASIVQREDGWLRGDLHMHTLYSDGFEDVATVVALAEYFEDAQFLEYNPRFEGDGLDFIAITDHDSTESRYDPGFVSERLILIGGEELGTSGHANRWGIAEHITVDTDGDGKSLEDVLASIEATQEEGGLYSANHPMIGGIPYYWDARTLDSLEVWNMGWTLASTETTEDDMLAWEVSHGDASPFAARAVQHRGITSSGQSLIMYEAMAALGVHVAMVGGSDRHALVLQGTPTTYVLATGDDPAGVLDGIRNRHTFVARNPAAAQVLVEVTVDGTVYQAGDEIPIPTGGTTAEVSIRVGRAVGGELRLMVGHEVEEDLDVLTAPLGEIALQEAVVGHDETFTTTLDVVHGDWLYPVATADHERRDLSTSVRVSHFDRVWGCGPILRAALHGSAASSPASPGRGLPGPPRSCGTG